MPLPPAKSEGRGEGVGGIRKDYNTRRRELWYALSTRVLTPDELREVGAFGSGLNIEDGVSYYASEKLMELTNALLIQQMLQTSNANPAPPHTPPEASQDA